MQSTGHTILLHPCTHAVDIAVVLALHPLDCVHGTRTHMHFQHIHNHTNKPIQPFNHPIIRLFVHPIQYLSICPSVHLSDGPPIHWFSIRCTKHTLFCILALHSSPPCAAGVMTVRYSAVSLTNSNRFLAMVAQTWEVNLMTTLRYLFVSPPSHV